MELTGERDANEFIMDKICTPDEVGPGLYDKYATFSKQVIEKPSHSTKRTKQIQGDKHYLKDQTT